MSTDNRVYPDASLSDDVYRCLKDYILGEITRPPERVQIGQLSRHFGVSITPIREALIRLATEHIVDLKPGRGFFFKDFVPEEQIRTYELLYFILKCSLEKRNETAAPLPDVTVRVLTDQVPLMAALSREALYIHIAIGSGNDQAVDLARNLCERTRNSRVLFFDQAPGSTEPVEELRELNALVGVGKNQDVIELLRRQFKKKARNMHMLANERQRRIYDLHPLLRPGSAAQLRRND
jgi:DNA-binding GntR family transcriptional regulator